MEWTVPNRTFAELKGDAQEKGENILGSKQNAAGERCFVQRVKKLQEEWMVLWKKPQGENMKQVMQLKSYISEETARAFMLTSLDLYASGEVDKATLEEHKKTYFKDHGRKTGKKAAEKPAMQEPTATADIDKQPEADRDKEPMMLKAKPKKGKRVKDELADMGVIDGLGAAQEPGGAAVKTEVAVNNEASRKGELIVHAGAPPTEPPTDKTKARGAGDG
eukprot:2565515-Pyramimonas_sp.AAC.1